MKLFAVSLVFFCTLGCASTSGTKTRDPARSRDFVYDMRVDELRGTPVFSSTTTVEDPYETLHEAFIAGTPATVDEVFPLCLDVDGVTVRRLPREATVYIQPGETVVKNDGGHQYCRFEFDIEVAPAQPEAGPRFPARPAKIERWMKVVRASIEKAPFPLSPGDSAHYRKQTEESATICKSEKDGTLLCKNLIDASIKKVFIRKDVAKAGTPPSYILHLANLESATLAAKPPAYVYIWETVPEPMPADASSRP